MLPGRVDSTATWAWPSAHCAVSWSPLTNPDTWVTGRPWLSASQA